MNARDRSTVNRMCRSEYKLIREHGELALLLPRGMGPVDLLYVRHLPMGLSHAYVERPYLAGWRFADAADGGMPVKGSRPDGWWT